MLHVLFSKIVFLNLATNSMLIFMTQSTAHHLVLFKPRTFSMSKRASDPRSIFSIMRYIFYYFKRSKFATFQLNTHRHTFIVFDFEKNKKSILYFSVEHPKYLCWFLLIFERSRWGNYDWGTRYLDRTLEYGVFERETWVLFYPIQS